MKSCAWASLQGCDDFFFSGLLIAPHDVFADGAGEQGINLQHHADLLTQIRQAEIAHVHVVDQYRAVGDVRINAG